MSWGVFLTFETTNIQTFNFQTSPGRFRNRHHRFESSPNSPRPKSPSRRGYSAIPALKIQSFESSVWGIETSSLPLFIYTYIHTCNLNNHMWSYLYQFISYIISKCSLIPVRIEHSRFKSFERSELSRTIDDRAFQTISQCSSIYII